MKKLVAIALIAAMATVANAGLAMVASGVDKDLVAPGLQVDAGDAVTISLTTAANFNGYGIDAIFDGGAGGAASDVWSGGAGLTYTLPGYQENSPTCLVSYVAAYASTNALPADVLVFSFSYTVAATALPGTITLSALPAGSNFYSNVDAAWYTAEAPYCNLLGVTNSIDSASFQVIPEPMTLGLLGLGGLFLRRRLA